MGGEISRAWDNIKRETNKVDLLSHATGGRADSGTFLLPDLKGQKDQLKTEWDKARGATKEKKEIAEAKRIAEIPKAEETAGMQDTKSLLARRGRAATRQVSRRSVLGGRSTLG